MSSAVAMTSERWLRLQTLFDRALALDAHARAEFVLRESGDDKLLREQLLSLVLASSQDAEEFDAHVDRQLSQQAATKELVAGTHIGRYRIVRLLGRGGMGAVYLAERADNQFKQQVAVKVVADSSMSARVAARLRSERQILANLNHPNIARLLDGGATRDGFPFFAMEYVDGQRIDHYCDAQHLTLQQRLRLFVQVCAAVQYAHQRLIIHRDIKSSNILVTADAVPKLLDFGIAKLVDPTVTDNVALTRVYERVLSPESASPEQVRGEPLGTESDVYALGVLLYQLVSGLRVFNFNGRSFAEIAKMILQEVPLKPSAAVLATDQRVLYAPKAELAKALVGELDVIVLKALQKEPARRYDSASALADDIENFLANRPIHARPDSVRYRVRKFWDRNRWAVSSATVALLAVVGLVIFYTWRLTLERDVAERERLTAARVASFMTDVFRVANPNESRGNTVPVREVLDAAVRRVDRDLSKEPRVRATLLKNMAQAYVGIGLWKSAEQLLQRAVTLDRSVFGDRSIQLADALTALAHVQTRLTDSTGAYKSLREAWSIREAAHAESNSAAVQTLIALAINRSDAGHGKEAMDELVQARTLAMPMAQSDPALLGQVYAATGQAYRDVGDYAHAETELRKALPLLRGTIEHGSDLYSEAVLSLVETYTKQSRVEESRQLLQQLLDEQIKVLGPNHPLVGNTWNSLGVALCESGEYTPCMEAFRHGVEIQERQPGGATMRSAIGYHNLGAASHDAGDLQGALQSFAKAQAVLLKLRGPNDANFLPMYYEQMGTLRDLGRLSDAEAVLARAEKLATQLPDGGGTFRGHLALERGRLSLARRQYPRAVGELRHALEIINPQDERQIAHARVALGRALLGLHRCDESADQLRTAVDSLRRLMPPKDWFIADAENKLGDALSVCGDAAAAEPLLTGSVAKLLSVRAKGDFVLQAAEQRLEAHRRRWPKHAH